MNDTTWTLPRLLEAALAASAVVMLRNAYGTLELRGDDLRLKRGERWLTIDHRSAPGTEACSHLHLRREGLRHAVILEREGKTPVLEIWPDRETAAGGGRAPLSVMFRSFYDWSNDKAPIPAHQAQFTAWVAANGHTFDLI